MPAALRDVILGTSLRPCRLLSVSVQAFRTDMSTAFRTFVAPDSDTITARLAFAGLGLFVLNPAMRYGHSVDATIVAGG